MDKFTVYVIFCVLISFKGAWSSSIVREPRVTNANETNEVEGKIVNVGHFAFIENHPYQAYLLLFVDSEMVECGGSIVNEYNIVTAAHCLDGASNAMVRIGSGNKENGGVTYASDSFYIHPGYNRETLDYDVGIVEISEGMALDGTMARAVRLVRAGHDPEVGDTIEITGWGATREGGLHSQALQYGAVPVVDREDCEESLDGPITPRMFCAGYSNGMVDACQGDGGGPAVMQDDGRLAGIISFGTGCARPETPGVYTRIGDPVIRFYIQDITGV